MSTRLKQMLFSNAVMIVCSFILGYSLWYMLSNNRVTQQTVQLPLIVRDSTGIPIKQLVITVQVEGPRQALQQFAQQLPNITLAQQTPDQHTIAIKKSDLMVPQTLHVLTYAPSEISV